VKRLFAWVAGAAGGLAAYRAVKGRRPRPEPQAGPDARAEELKARLQQAREVAGDRDSADLPVDGAEPLDPELPDPGARRAQVHEQGRAALDEMRGEQRS
jgi:hypothetical protein